MHKLVCELKPNDMFLMAGFHYRIVEVRDTADEDLLKVVFVHVDSMIHRRFYLTIDASQLFSLT